ncbi:MAG: hypothetical protein MUE65_07275, partial [Methanomassiliicoccales archaeon]|nr:hypothetical protein [Methanomassiliicoccales archaeon]
MIEDLLMLTAGLVVIFFGGKWTIDGASQITLRIGVEPYAVGMTIVAFGTSMPELFIGIISSVEGQGQISLGNAIGSNITNLTLMLGSCAVITPIIAKYSGFRHGAYSLIGSTALLILLSLDGSLGVLDGLVLLSGLFLYIGFTVYNLRR